MLKFPEVALFCGTWLLIMGHGSFGVSLMIISLLAAFFKWSLELHLKRQELERKNAILTMVTDVHKKMMTRNIS